MAHKRFLITETMLRTLYQEQQLTMNQIATMFGCSTEVVRRRLNAYGIPSRNHSEAASLKHEINISAPELHKFYIEQQMSTYEVARQFNCSPATVRKYLRIFGIPKRSRFEGSLARIGVLALLKDFSGDLAEKAYLIAFRLGDLTSVKRHPTGDCITIYGSSTRSEQVELVYQLFSKYGHVRVTQTVKNKIGLPEQHMLCSLNATFDFLLEKPDVIPSWIYQDPQYFVAFMGGLIDAEGSFSLYKTNDTLTRGKFSLEMTNKLILEQCRNKLVDLGISCSNLSLHKKANHTNKQGVTSRKDLWQFVVSRKDSLLHFIALLEPWLKHTKRRSDMQRVKENIEWRNSSAFQLQVRERRIINRKINAVRRNVA